MDFQLAAHAMKVLVSVCTFFALPVLASFFLEFSSNEQHYDRRMNLFAWNLSWLIFIVILWANIFTKGQTLLNGIWILLLLGYFLNRKKNGFRIGIRKKASISIDINSVLEVGFFILVFLGIRFVFYTDTRIGFTNFGIMDYIIYSRDAAWLKTAGVENLNLDPTSPHGSYPYHYFDLWLYSMFGTVLKFNSSSLLAGAGTVLLTISALGSSAFMMRSLKSSSWLIILFVSAVFFYSGFYLNRWDSHDFLHFVKMYSVSLYGNP